MMWKNNTIILLVSQMVFLLLVCSGSLNGQIVVNEFMADNKQTISDPDFNNFGDWVELYNAGNTDVDLAGYGLSDDAGEPGKWRFPSGITIDAKGFLLVWTDNDATGIHTNFRLSKTGEQVVLSDASLVIIDSISFSEQIEDVSYGRKTDGGTTWVYFSQPTPGYANSESAGDWVAAKPVFSMESGFYSGSQTVTLTAQSANADILYTLDGSEPDAGSQRYRNPIQLDTTSIVRAIQTEEGYLNSPIANRTFLIDENTTLPVFSIVTDPDNLWDEDTGIYTEGRDYTWGWGNGNFWQNWEKPCYVEFWEADRKLKISHGAALKITGALTRTASQKSLRLIAKSEYGKKKFTYPLFPDKDISSYNDIVLRSSGNDWARTMMADGLMATIVAGQIDIDYQAYRPAILFLNGQYWGIHNIREKVGDDYIEENHGFPKDNLDFLSQTDDIREGDAQNYDALLNFIQSSDLNNEANYEYVAQRVDIQEYINYYVTQIFYANHDWPAGNIKYWRPRTEPSLWRWILFDTDMAFQQFFLNTIAWVTDPNPTYEVENDFFIGMMTSRQFQKQFIDTYQYLMATTFAPERIIPIIDELQETIRPEISRHINRWKGYHGWTFTYDGNYMETGWLESFADWERNVNSLKTFALNRPEALNQFVNDHFGFGGTVDIVFDVSPQGSGKVWINEHRATSEFLKMVCFENQEFTIQPLANANSVFDEWVIEKGFYHPGDMVPMVPKNSTWKYLDNGQFPGTNWVNNNFDDSGWAEGPGVLGYNFSDAQTIISYGEDAAQKHLAYWFRHQLTIDNPSDWRSLQVELLRDDGALVYLNGDLVISSNMPDNADHNSTALVGVDESNEHKYFTFEIPANHLVSGNNVLAVQVHQISQTSSDLSFDLALFGETNINLGEQVTESDRIISFTAEENISYQANFSLTEEPVILSINEVMADNLKTVVTDYGKTPDWVEIYNPNDFDVDLGGLYLTDNLLIPDKFQIPDDQPIHTIVPAKGFLVFIADGQRLYHSGYVNLQFSSLGEEVGLYQKINDSYFLIDSLLYPPLGTDMSFGRFPDGEDEWYTFEKTPTPGTSNKINNQEVPDQGLYLIQNYPNPFTGQTTIPFGVMNEEPSNVQISIRNLQGNLMKELTFRDYEKGEYEITWDGTDASGKTVASGVYLVVLRSGFYADVRKMIFIR